MKFDLKKATTYFWNDKHITRKILIGYALITVYACLSTFVRPVPNQGYTLTGISIGILCFLILLIICGYNLYNAQTRIYKPESKLPDWNNILLFIKKSITMIVCAMILGIIAGIIMYILHTIIGLIPNPLIYTETVAEKIKIQQKISACMLIFFNIIIVYCTNAMLLSYITDLKFKSFFNLKAFKIIAITNFTSFLKYLCFIVLLLILFIVTSLILAISIVGILLIPLIGFYAYCITSDLQAQFIRNAFKIETNEK